MFRLAERDHHITRKRLQLETGIPYNTLKSYATGTEMPMSAFVKLAAVIPNELVSLLLEPAGKHLADDEADHGSLHELAREVGHFSAEYIDAVSDGSVTHIEKARLKDRARRLASAAGAIA